MTTLEQLPERVTELEMQVLQLRAEARNEFSALRHEIRDGDEETRRYMRVLHEEVIARLATIQEGQTPPVPRRRRKT